MASVFLSFQISRHWMPMDGDGSRGSALYIQAEACRKIPHIENPMYCVFVPFATIAVTINCDWN